MRKLIVFALMLSACQGSFTSDPSNTLLQEADSIVGGVTVSPESPLNQKAFSLRVLSNPKTVQEGDATTTYYSVSQCTASALTPRIILTAAHCVSSSATVHRIELPTADGKKAIYKVAKAIANPDYAKDGVSDLALMLLEISLPENIETLSLPPRDVDLDLKKITAAGFGRVDGRKSVPGNLGILRTVELDVVSYSKTSATFHVDQTAGKGICQGDSGGPAMIDINGKTVVVGVVSKTRYTPSPDGDHDYCNFRGQYVNVQKYLDWIFATATQLAKE
ncbi:S1 family peptidase [Bdellovibrio sp.]|uniref:S1 family peptidase n=1 Tax=Bdellovibrio sp. TaxID=28201 RepID=UPI0039E3BD00